MAKTKKTPETAERENVSIFDAKDKLVDKLHKIGELGKSSEENRKSMRQRSQEQKEAINQLSEEIAEELFERLSSDTSGLAAHFRSMGRFLGKYNKTNQLLIQAQRPETLGVASRSTWERYGYEPSGIPLKITQNITFVKGNDPAVLRWANENPLKEVLAWYERTTPAKEGKSFAEYVLDRLSSSTNETYKGLVAQIENFVVNYCQTETPSDEQRKMALGYYMKTKTAPVVRGISLMSGIEEVLEKQERGETDGWFMRPPYRASKALVAFCSFIYGKKLGGGAVKRTPDDEERARKSFISRYNKWSNESYMKSQINQNYSELRDAQSENRKNGIETPPSMKVGGYPVLNSPRLADAYAYEDVTPGEKARVPSMLVHSIKCDEELYEAVKGVFRMEFPVEEVPGILPDAVRSTKKEGAVYVSMSDGPEKRVLDIVREWSTRKAAELGSGSKVFSELFALSVMTSIGMDNPHVDEIAMKGLGKDELRDGIEKSYSAISGILKRLQKHVGAIVEKKAGEFMQKVISERASKIAEEVDETEPGEISGADIDDISIDWM